MPISKHDALQLAADIKRANISAHALAQRTGGGPGSAYSGFVGGLTSTIAHFVDMQAGSEARAAILAAFDYEPTEADIAARNAELASYRTQASATRGAA